MQYLRKCLSIALLIFAVYFSLIGKYDRACFDLLLAYGLKGIDKE